MSDPKLYRWTNQSNGAWVDTESMRQELVADGVLVPVEPDYEHGAAVMAAAYENGAGDGPALLKIGMDAALGALLDGLSDE